LISTLLRVVWTRSLSFSRKTAVPGWESRASLNSPWRKVSTEVNQTINMSEKARQGVHWHIKKVLTEVYRHVIECLNINKMFEESCIETQVSDCRPHRSQSLNFCFKVSFTLNHLSPGWSTVCRELNFSNSPASISSTSIFELIGNKMRINYCSFVSWINTV